MNKTSIKKGLKGKYLAFANKNRHLLPNFIIIGSAKSATTTLRIVLQNHPDIFFSGMKEPKFFGKNFDKGWEWYTSRFILGENFPLRGEASTMYTSNSKKYRRSAKLMNIYLPEIKLIYIVRNPCDRLVSQWRHRKGRDQNTPEFNSITTNKRLRRLLVGCSMYYKRLSEYRKYYQDKQIHCITYEDFLSKPNEILENTQLFLGVEPRSKDLLLENGNLPLENKAGEKGRVYVEKPKWDNEVKEKILQKIRPDAKEMLTYMGKSTDYWEL